MNAQRQLFAGSVGNVESEKRSVRLDLDDDNETQANKVGERKGEAWNRIIDSRVASAVIKEDQRNSNAR